MGRVLIVAFHFPPCAGTSGVLRSLNFSRYLPQSGWQPVVLTVHPRAYEETEPGSVENIPEDLPVLRVFTLDVKRHLGFRGLYQDWMALPDRWASWLLGAIPAGLRAIRKFRVDVIFSTFPISTAILIGFVLHLLTGKPWVVDFRDSMTEELYPPQKYRRVVWRWIERRAVRNALRLVFTTPSARRMYLQRYPNLAPEKCLVISNGYNEDDFTTLKLSPSRSVSEDLPLHLLHTGMLYRDERDPRPFFQAVSRLKCEGKVSASSLRVILRSPSSEDFYAKFINDLDIADLVEIRPTVPHGEALQECADVDALLLFQAANCDHQIPAKAYEYLRIGKPILALTTRTGDTATLLEEVGGATITSLADENEIYSSLPAFLASVQARTHALPSASKIRRYARNSQAEALARCLSELHSVAPLAISHEKESLTR
jgi:glycosyltransferase involved in cell wall biosynthesis